ncbi:MAG TPA: methylmalonyl-CoA mutase [Candidatus Syntrophoarchaeum butanivorans]|uniref:Methylmalonyl-CoA mutase n=1 Tax=Candidatus Syntropharchaeum butanivorans TaxID=1839936 RepID=A0A1F2P459_9EURY|nr:MAG: methylmalonyl-CoA mutase subunit alpha [Candidatus Syntrophoarchaeum butanivorans]HEC57248.1 methylmalonyl-CoA mutase [Candidatus Syntrophoarchaeum butanivorans]
MNDLRKIEEEEKKWMERARQKKERQERFETYSGIPVKAIYTPLDLKDHDYLRDEGFPGFPPFTRGVYPTMYRGSFWTTRQFSGHGTPEETNERWKLLYKEGETGFSAAMDSLTFVGLDPSDPNVEPEVGTDGVPLYCKPAVEALVKDLPIDKVSVAFPIECLTSAPVSAMYFNVYMERGFDLATCKGTTQNDILTMSIGYVQYKSLDPAHLLKLACDLIEWCTADKNVPKWHPINFTTYNYREGGIDAIQELGFGFANAIEHIEHLIERGRKPEEFVDRLAFHLSAHNDFFEEIAKYRAARRIWAKLLRDRYGIEDPKHLGFRYHIQTAGSSLTRQQPMVNIIRTTVQALAAALGGCQSMHTNSYDEAICLPTEESVTLAVRTQLVLKEESRIGNVIDPLGGSYYIEWLTDEIEDRVWKYLDKIEQVGGIVKALETGWIYREMAEAFHKRRRAIETGEERVIGVNCYVSEEKQKVEVFRTNPNAAKIEQERIKKLKAERDNRKIEELLDKLRRVCEREENVMPVVMELMGKGATLYEVCDTYRDVWGEWKQPIVF